MANSRLLVSDFMQTLLKKSIGKLVIEEAEWDFPEDAPMPFSRTYFTERLKKETPINQKTYQGLLYLFSYLFSPNTHSGKYREPEAVKASNAVIELFSECFSVDLSIFANEYAKDNVQQREHILHCLDNVLRLNIDTRYVDTESCAAFLKEYLSTVTFNANKEKASAFPTIIGNAPYQQTDYFIGRDNTVDTVAKHLLQHSSCYLYGIGGIGKTEIAKGVYKKIISTPKAESGITHILWIDYVENSFAVSLTRILEPNETNIDIAFNKAVNRLNQYNDRLLLIIDNVEETEDVDLMSISAYLSCRILITSRCKGYQQLKQIEIPSLDTPYCESLFMHYYHGEKDETSLSRIIELADRHTVTIELLSKIADTSETTLSDFLQTLIECGFNIGDEEATATHEKLRSEDRIIEQLKKLFHVYGFDAKEETLLVQISAIPNLPFVFNQAKKWFNQNNRSTLNALSDRGWLKKKAMYNNESNRYCYIMHSVIAAAVRAQYLDCLYDMCQSFIREITTDMQKSVDENDTFKKNLIQFSWSLNDIFKNSFHNEADCTFLWTLAEIYRDIGLYARTIPILDQLMELYRNIYGEDCTQMGSVWNSKGMAEYQLSHFEKALDCYLQSEKILNGMSKDAKSVRVDLARLKVNIGKIYLKENHKLAESYINEAYDIFKSDLGEDHCDTLNALMHKAEYQRKEGNDEDAEEIFLDVLKKMNGKKDRESLLLKASTAHVLGNLYSDTQPEKAMPYFETAREIFTTVLSPTNPDTLDVINSICSMELFLRIDVRKALHDLSRLLPMYIKIYGHDDPNTAVILVNMGLAHYYLDEFDCSIDFYEEALQIYNTVYNGDNAEFAYLYNNIGASYSDSKRPKKAIPYHEKAIKILEKTYEGQRNLDLAQSYSELADAYLQLGMIAETQEQLNKCFAMYDDWIEEDSYHYIQPYSTLGKLFYTTNDLPNAEAIFTYVINILNKNGFSNDSPEVEQFLQCLKEIREKMNSSKD